MRTALLTPILFFLALSLAPSAGAQTSEFEGTWSTLAYRTMVSEGDTIQAPAAQTMVLRAGPDAVTGLEHRVVSFPEGAWGPGSMAGELSMTFEVEGSAPDDGAVQLSMTDVRGGRTTEFRAMLTHDGQRLSLTPPGGPHHDPQVYRRVPTAPSPSDAR